MNFEAQLNQALGITNPISEEYIDRSSWMTADDDIVQGAAYGGKKRFWREIKKLAQDIGDQSLMAVANAGAKGELENTNQVRDIMRELRKEARFFANERGIRPLAPTDKIAMSPEELEAAKAKREKERAEAPPRKFLGDELYGVFDQTGKLIRGGFYNEHDAESYMNSDLPDGQYEIKLYENPKSLSKLKDTKLPLQHGWTVGEVVNSLYPWISRIAWKYHSQKAPYEDLVQHGAIGVINALRTDKGEAPIGSHAWRHILGEIRRAALTGGIVTSTEAPGAATFGQAGVLVGYEVKYTDESGDIQTQFFPADIQAMQKYFSEIGRTPPSTQDPSYRKAEEYKGQLVKQGIPADKIEVREKRGRLASTEAPVAGKEGGTPQTLGALLKGKGRKPESILAQPEMVKTLMDRAKLTDKQREVVNLLFGLDVPEAGSRSPRDVEGEHEPGQQAGKEPEQFVDPETGKVIRTVSRGAEKEGVFGRSIADVAKMTGKTSKAVRVIRDNALLALANAAKEYAAELKARGLIEKPEELASTEGILKKVMSIEEGVRREILESLRAGEIDCLFE